MDIDDILREADPSFESAPRGNQDLQALTRAWVVERSAPELLEWPTDGLIERVNARVRRQIEKVEELTNDITDAKANFSLIVLQTELERWKYLVRGFLRARMAKIDKYALHYLSSPETRSLLSAQEIAYATRHQALLQNHYTSSFLSFFPQSLKGLDDAAGGISMIDKPDVETAVFVRLLRDKVVVARGRDADGRMEGRKGEVLVVRWADIKELVRGGDAELV